MTQAPPLNGQVIGQAERATRAVLDLLLVAENTSFVNWVTLNLTATQGETKSEALVDQLVIGLRIDQTEAQIAIDELGAAGLLTAGEVVRLTTEGEAKYARIGTGIAEIAARLYRDLPHDDLVIARRILETVTARARAELFTG
jgi:DNA-binding MarR family transcriptional regulator